ncbi:MAG: hypothetical protein LC126_05730 [Bryobacterales bacterium]|nr:hypothetical protein [Bryobacterales bacterium]
MVPAVAVKLPLDAPAATVTDAGTMSAALLLKVAIEVFAVAAFDNTTAHVADAPDPSDVGVHDSDVNTAGLTSDTAADCVTPFNEAVTVAVLSAVNVPAVAAKLPLDAPAATVTDVGTVRLELLSETAATVFTVTAFDKLTVHVADAPDPNDVGVHANEVNTAGLTSDNDVDTRTPFNEAFNVTVPSAVTVPAVAVKLPLDAPAATVTDVGTVRLALLSDTATAVFTVTAFDKLTVHVADAPDPNDVGVHTSDVNTAGLTSDNDVDTRTPFNEAFNVTVPSAVTVPAVAVKLPLDAPAATVTDVGTVRLALLSDTATAVFTVTAFDKLTVHVADAPDPNDVGVHTSDVNTAGLTSDNDVDTRTPFNEAFNVTVPSAVTVPAVAVKLPLDAPAATVTDVGTVRLALLSDTATAVFTVTAFDKLTVHVADAPDPNDVGVHTSDVNTAGLTSDNDVDTRTPFNEAFNVTVPSAVTVPAVAVKLPLDAPAATVTDVGTVRLALLSDTATAVFTVTAFDKLTVHVADAPDPNDVGVQTSDVSVAGLSSVKTTAWELPFNAAVTWPEVSAATEAALAVKLAVLAPPATVTLAGTEMSPVLLLTETLTPPLGACCVSPTVHTEDPGVFTVAGEHPNVAIVGEDSTVDTTCTTPPVAVIATWFPLASAPTTPVN